MCRSEAKAGELGECRAERNARRIPSRASDGSEEGVETRRLSGIAGSKTPQAPATGNGEEIVQCCESVQVYGQLGHSQDQKELKTIAPSPALSEVRRGPFFV